MPVFYDRQVDSALMLGTAQYPSPAIMAEAFRASNAGIATVSLRREGGAGQAAPGRRPSPARLCRGRVVNRPTVLLERPRVFPFGRAFRGDDTGQIVDGFGDTCHRNFDVDAIGSYLF